MTLESFISLTRRRAGVLLAVIVACVLAAAVVVRVTPVTYTASAVAYVRVNVPVGAQDDTEAHYAATQMAPRKITAIVPVFTSEAVGQRVVDALGLEATAASVAQSLTATHAEDTATVSVSATAASAAEARSVADEAVLQAAQEVSELEGETSPVEVILMTPSRLSGVTRSPNAWAYLGLGALGGVVLGYLWIIFRELSDRRLHGAKAVIAAGRAAPLGAVPSSRSIAEDGPLRGADPDTEEELRRLRTNLLHVGPKGDIRVLVVSSARRQEGRTTVSVGLARVMAALGRRVVLVEGDLRAPSLAHVLGLPADVPGLSQLLEGTASLEEVLVSTSTPGLEILPAGATPSNPSELLASADMSTLLQRLSTAHTVIIDSPPLLQFTDGAILAEQADGVLMVVRSARTTGEDLNDAVLAVEQGGAEVLGTVLNRAPASRRGRRRVAGQGRRKS